MGYPITSGLREAGNGWLLMRLLMCADHLRLLCHLGGEAQISRLWAVHRDWVIHACRQPSAIPSEIISGGASPDTMAEFQLETPPLVRWFAGHPSTLASLPGARPSGNIGDARRPPAPGRFNQEQRLASMCGTVMLLEYLITPRTGPTHWRRSEFASSWWS
jgi:hypothetical protein